MARKRTGVKLGRLYIVHLNRDFVRDGELDLEALFIKDDSTEQTAEIATEISEETSAKSSNAARFSASYS